MERKLPVGSSIVGLGLGLLASVAAAGCDKSSPNGTITPPADPSSAASVPAASQKVAELAPSPSSSAAPAPTPSETAPAATAAASGSAKPDKVAAADAGKPKPGASASGAAAAAPLKPASKRFTGNNFALDVSTAGCKAAEECNVTLKLTPTGEFHVNKEYPYKFLATPAAGVSFLGKSDANSFGKQWGDYVEQGEKAGLLTVRFKAAAPGEARVAGKYKLSVCSAAQCLIEEQQVDLAVPVM